MPYVLPLADGRTAEFPDDFPREEAIDLVRRYAIKLRGPETPGAVGQFLRRAGLGAAPMVAGLKAFGPSAALGAPAGGIGGLATGVVGSTLAALATAYGQEKLLEAAPELAKTLGVDAETMARGAEANPVADKLGLIAPIVAAFKPSSPVALFRKPKGETPEAVKAALEARRGERIAAGVGAGLGGGIDAAIQLAGDAPFDPVQTAMMAGAGAIFRDPNRLGKLLLGKRGMQPFARPGETPPPPPALEVTPGAPSPEVQPDLFGAPPPRMEQGELFPVEEVPTDYGPAPVQPDLFPQGELDLRFPPETGQGDLFGAPVTGRRIPPGGTAPEAPAPEAVAPEAGVVPKEEQLPLEGVESVEIFAAKKVIAEADAGTRFTAAYLRKVADSLKLSYPKNANSKRLLDDIRAEVNRVAPEPPPRVRTPEEQPDLFGAPPPRMEQGELFPVEEVPTDYGPAPVQGELTLEPPAPPASRPAPKPASLTEQPELDLRFPQEQGDLFASPEPIPPRGVAPEPEVPAVERPLPEGEQLPLTGVDTPEVLAAKNAAQTVLDKAAAGTRYEARMLRRVADSVGAEAPKNAGTKQLLKAIDTAVNPPEPPEAIAAREAAEAAAKKAADEQAAAEATAKKAADEQAAAEAAAAEAAKKAADQQAKAEAAAEKARRSADAKQKKAADAAAKKAADDAAAAAKKADDAAAAAKKAADDAAAKKAATETAVAPDEPAFDAGLANRATQAFSQNAAEAVPLTPAESPTPRAEPVVVAPAVSQSPFSNLIRQGGFKQAIDSLSTAKTPLFKAVSTAIKNVLGDSPSRVVAEGNQLAPEDAGVITRLRQEGKLAEYDPKTDTYFFTNEGMTPKTFLHEAIHAASIQVLKAFKEGGKLTGVQRSAAKRIDDIFKKSKPLLGDEFQSAYENVYEFLSAALTDGDLQRALAKLKSEDLGMTFGKAKAPTVWDRVVDAVARMFGLDRAQMDNALLQVANSFEDVLTAPRAGVDMNPLPSRKTAPAAKAPRSVKEIEESFGEEMTEIPTRGESMSPVNFGRRAFRMFTDKAARQKAYTGIVRRFQNRAVAIKNLQKSVRNAGLKSSIYDVFNSLGSNTALRWMEIQPVRERINANVGAYAAKKGLTEAEAIKRMHVLIMGASERELRGVRFVDKVPLSAAADERRIKIFDQLSKGVSDAEAVKLRQELDALIAKDIATESVTRFVKGSQHTFKDADLDIDSPRYNGVGDYTKEELQSMREFYQKEYAENPEIAELFNPEKGLFRQVKDYTIRLNKESGFHSAPLDGVIAFYGRANYFPFKGMAGAVAKDAEKFNYNSVRHSGNLTEFQNKGEGRDSDSNNSFLQLLSDASKAASRVSTNKLVDEVIALNKFMPDKITRLDKEQITFNDRYMTGLERKNINTNDRIFRHRSDGVVEVWKISDRELLDALKGFSKDPAIGWQVLNKVTSLIAANHTRYNPAFPVYNYTRDAITSGGIVGADLGPKVGARYTSSVLSKITDGGLLKAAKVARLLQSGKIADIRKLVSGGDEFYKSLVDYIDNAGVVTYQEAINTWSLQQELKKDLAGQLGKTQFAKTLKNVTDVFDIWTNTFELGTRAAGYDAILPEMIARRQQQLGRKLTADELANVKFETTQYVRGLFNYSEVGEYGREMGAFFMFMRPAMTGAVRFWEAFSPAFSSVESRLASVPKEIFDVPTVQKMLQQEAVARGENVSGDAAKAALQTAAEKEVAKRRDTYIKNFEQQQRSARIVSMAAAGAGFALYNMSLMMSDNDEMGRNKVLNDNMDIWQRNIRIPLPKDMLNGVDYLQIPSGFGFGAFTAFGAQLASFAAGGQSFTDVLENAVPIAIDSAFPVPAPQYSPFDNPGAFFTSLMLPSVARPFVEYAMNVDAFGREIYQNRMNQFGSPYTGGETLPEAYTIASSFLADIANQAGMDVPELLSPKTLHFFANSYADGVARIIASGMGLALYAGGGREFDIKEDVLPFASFLGRSTSVDAREFADVKKEVANIARQLKILENYPEKLAGYLNRNPNAQIIVDYFNGQENGRLRGVRERANQIRRDPNLSNSEKREMLRDLNFERDWLMSNIIASVKAWM